MGNWKNSFERIFTFSDFFGRPGNIFLFFRCILRGLVVQIEFHKPRWTYPLGKNLWEHFLSFPDYECIFLNIHWSLLGMLSKLQFTCSEEHFEKGSGLWGKVFKLSLKYIRHGCQNYSLRVQRSTLRKVIIFWDFFRIVFGLWVIIVHTSCEKFQQRCANCILRVQRVSRFFLQNFVMFHLTSCSSENKS